MFNPSKRKTETSKIRQRQIEEKKYNDIEKRGESERRDERKRRREKSQREDRLSRRRRRWWADWLVANGGG